MSIEPLNSAMTYQAQTAQPKPVQQPSKAASEYTEVSAPESVQIDPRVSVVTQTGSNEKQGEAAPKEQQNNPEQLKKAVEQFNKRLGNSEAVFGIHDATNRIVIKIVDKETKELIKELPPEKTLDMIAKIWELAGVLIDEKR